jgi:4-methylaminobutanoate oxidase (formaldehyde-forming)
MLNARGTYESDLTVVRLGPERFYVITATQQARHDADWMLRQVPAEADFCLRDVTEEIGVVSVMGPRSRDVLARVTAADLSNAAFPFGHCQEISLAGVAEKVLALRVTYVGELGWELHGPAAAMPGVWKALMAAGAPEGIRPAGTYSINAMRLEKAYRAWGHEISVDENPFEAGLGFAVDWTKEFLGKTRLLELKGQPLRKRLVSLVMDTDDAAVTLWGNEPVFRDGVIAGYTSSAAFSPTLGKPVAMAYVKRPPGEISLGVSKAWIESGAYTILQDGKHWPARALLQSPVDPERSKVLA